MIMRPFYFALLATSPPNCHSSKRRKKYQSSSKKSCIASLSWKSRLWLGFLQKQCYKKTLQNLLIVRNYYIANHKSNGIEISMIHSGPKVQKIIPTRHLTYLSMLTFFEWSKRGFRKAKSESVFFRFLKISEKSYEPMLW